MKSTPVRANRVESNFNLKVFETSRKFVCCHKLHHEMFSHTILSVVDNAVLKGVFICFFSTLPFYTDPKCNLLNGTDGTTLGTYVDTSKRYYLFHGDACRYASKKEGKKEKRMREREALE